jgi:CRISPR/Cas system CMR subunit Cmr6 (Cas7 group RAMP superfamily)
MRKKDALNLEVVNALTAPAGQSVRTAKALRRLGSTKTKIERKTNALRSLFGAGGAALGGYSGADPEQRTVVRRALGL